LWPCWSWTAERELWAGKYKTTGHGSLIITTLTGRVTFVSEPVPGNQHDMAKLKGSECEMILKLASDAIGDKGFIGTDYRLFAVSSGLLSVRICRKLLSVMTCRRVWGW
jgi:hypothetical protein